MRNKYTDKQRADLRAQIRTVVVVLAIFLFVLIFALVVAANRQPRSPGADEPQGFTESRGTLA